MFDFTTFGFCGEITTSTYGKDAKRQAVSRGELSILFQDVLKEATAFGNVVEHGDGDPILEHEHSTATEGETAEQSGIEEVAEMIGFPGGPDIPCVRDFDCTVDRLFFDFEGSEDDAPDITIDFVTFPGHALVKANGTAVTLIVGAEDLTVHHVDIFMSGSQPQVHHTPKASSATKRFPRLLPQKEEDICTSTSKSLVTMH